MKTPRVYVEFKNEIEGSYIIEVTINDRDFDITCQFGMDHDYKESNRLECRNESGGDIYDSGLVDYLNSIRIEDDTERFNAIINKIENCANDQKPENTIIRVLAEALEDDGVKHELGLFGAFGPTDVHHKKYKCDDGTIVVASIDTSESKAENALLGYKKFETEGEYNEWHDEITDGIHHGDCAASYRAWWSITGY